MYNSVKSVDALLRVCDAPLTVPASFEWRTSVNGEGLSDQRAATPRMRGILVEYEGCDAPPAAPPPGVGCAWSGGCFGAVTWSELAKKSVDRPGIYPPPPPANGNDTARTCVAKGCVPCVIETTTKLKTKQKTEQSRDTIIYNEPTNVIR